MADLAVFYVANKLLASPSVQWVERDSETVFWTSPIEIDGVAIEGLRFRLTAIRSLPDEAVTCQLEYHERRKIGGPFYRMDWRPLHEHCNKGQGPPELRLLRITGTHHHEFNVNWTFAATQVRRGNLPIAIAVTDEPQTFEELLAFLGKELTIGNIGLVPRPPWQAGLF